MSDNPVKEVLSDLFPYLESLETKCAAILAFLKEKGISTDEQIAPYLDQAAQASGVRWHAARVRMEHLFAVAPEIAAKSSHSPAEKAAEGGVDKGKKDESSASGDKETSTREAKGTKPAAAPEADGSTEKKTTQTADNTPENVGSDANTQDTSKPDKHEAQPEEPREKDAA